MHNLVYENDRNADSLCLTNCPRYRQLLQYSFSDQSFLFPSIYLYLKAFNRFGTLIVNKENH